MLRNTKLTWWFSYCAVFLLLAGCVNRASPTLFVPPSSPKKTPTPAQSVFFSSPEPSPAVATALAPTAAPTEPTATPNATEAASPTPACTSSLKYLQDLTYPDGSLVAPGQTVEKQWRVENNGTCDWDERYRLKLLDGFLALGTTGAQALYPARAGAQATISISFTAPWDAGTYRTSWQAVDPQGNPFGEPIYMEIVVQP